MLAYHLTSIEEPVDSTEKKHPKISQTATGEQRGYNCLLQNALNFWDLTVVKDSLSSAAKSTALYDWRQS